MTTSKRRYRVEGNETVYDNLYSAQRFVDSTRVKPLRPAWKTKKRPPYTTVRILPGFDPDAKGRVPDVTRLDDGGLGDFIRCYPAWRMGGNPSLSILCCDKSVDPNYDIFTNPAHLLYMSVKRAVEKEQDHPEWHTLIKGSAGKSALIPPVKDTYLIQGLVYECGDSDVGNTPWGGAQDDLMPMIDLGNDLGRKLMAMIRQQIEDENTGELKYVLRDPIALCEKTARIFTFYPLEVGPPDADPKQSMGYGKRRTSGSRDTGKPKEIGYGISVAREFGDLPAMFDEDQAREIMRRVQPWDDILKFYSDEEQAAMIRKTVPWNVLEYAWRDHPEWLPEDCPEAIAAKKRTTSGYGGRGGRDTDDGDDGDYRGSIGRGENRASRGSLRDDDDDDTQYDDRSAAAAQDDDYDDEPQSRRRSRAPQDEDVDDTPRNQSRRSRAAVDDDDDEPHDTTRTRSRAAPPDDDDDEPRATTRTTSRRSSAADDDDDTAPRTRSRSRAAVDADDDDVDTSRTSRRTRSRSTDATVPDHDIPADDGEFDQPARSAKSASALQRATELVRGSKRTRA